jgi:hypothetical protein
MKISLFSLPLKFTPVSIFMIYLIFFYAVSFMSERWDMPASDASLNGSFPNGCISREVN